MPKSGSPENPVSGRIDFVSVCLIPWHANRPGGSDLACNIRENATHHLHNQAVELHFIIAQCQTGGTRRWMHLCSIPHSLAQCAEIWLLERVLPCFISTWHCFRVHEHSRHYFALDCWNLQLAVLSIILSESRCRVRLKFERCFKFHS